MSFTPITNNVSDSPALYALIGLLPLIVFFVLLGAFKVKTHYCALVSLATAISVAVFGFKMPTTLALLSATQGAAFGFLPILYIIIAAVWLYNLTEVSGRSADVRMAFNIVGKGDQRIQGLLLAFSFCGLLEGLAGFGAPVAIVAAMLVTVGLHPVKAAVATIAGNCINVGYGAVAIPLTTGAKLGGTTAITTAGIAGCITPYLVVITPLLLLLILDGLRGLKQLWPAALFSGLVTGAGHILCTNFFSYELTAILSSLLGFLALTLLLQIWNPTTPEECRSEPAEELPLKRAVLGLLPYWLVVIVFGIAKLWTVGLNIPELLKLTDLQFPWPGLDGHLLTADGKPLASTVFSVQTLGSPGTLLALTAVIVTVVYGTNSSDGKYPFSFAQGIKTLFTTIYGLRIAILTIATVMALAYVMNFSGQTAAIGIFLAGSGAAFAFLSPVLGWIGTAVTGSATSANALFANLQSTVANQVGADPNLFIASNTIGGGLGKVVSPQNLAIAATAVGEKDIEPLLLRKVAPISFGFLAILCLLIGLASMGFLWGI